ncbi:MAG: nitronate monooxygenase [Candidatus Obscuribacterales bacterium]
MTNQLLEKLGIEVPIIQAPMAGVSTPEMAAAVCNASALGSIGVGATNADGARSMIRATQQLTAKPFNVNLFCHQPATQHTERETQWIERLRPTFEKFGASPPPKLEDIYKSFVEDVALLEVLLEMQPHVVSFHFGLPPEDFIAKLRGAGIVLLATATDVHEAKQLEAAGIDGIVAQGYEAGGHRGIFNQEKLDECMGTLPLTQLLTEETKVPIIAAGGIMDGAGIKAALRAGASAAQLGTAFIDCPESSADKFYRERLHSDAAHHTIMTSVISGRPARCLQNLFSQFGEQIEPHMVPEYPRAYHAGKELNAAAKQAGEGGYGAQWAGEGAPFARSLPAAELIAHLKLEMERAG